MEETWQTIPGFSLYQASNLGNLRSLNYKRTGKTQVLKPALDDGYLKTMLLSDSGKYKSKTVHYFMGITYFNLLELRMVNPKIEMNHKDTIKTNNAISNLEAITKSKNILHAYANGCIKPKRGELNGMSKLTESDVLEIREAAIGKGRYYGRKQLAEKYNVSEAHIKDLVSRRRGIWSHI